MFICWFGELMGDDTWENLAKLSDETLDMYIAITYDDQKFSLWFEL